MEKLLNLSTKQIINQTACEDNGKDNAVVCCGYIARFYVVVAASNTTGSEKYRTFRIYETYKKQCKDR
ncbi:MAG: hypothetical protein LBF79_01420 [Dysgonamonadaceae bacterium]|nr:hypothetical protein [Dysgonamonadaceae bacterium]